MQESLNKSQMKSNLITLSQKLQNSQIEIQIQDNKNGQKMDQSSMDNSNQIDQSEIKNQQKPGSSQSEYSRFQQKENEIKIKQGDSSSHQQITSLLQQNSKMQSHNYNKHSGIEGQQFHPLPKQDIKFQKLLVDLSAINQIKSQSDINRLQRFSKNDTKKQKQSKKKKYQSKQYTTQEQTYKFDPIDKVNHNQLQFVQGYFDNLQILQPQQSYFLKKHLKTNIEVILSYRQLKHDKYKLYNVQQNEKQPRTYFILNLSFWQVNVNDLVKPRWENLVQLQLTNSGITDQGWKTLIGQIQTYRQLRKIHLNLNQIRIVTQADMKELDKLLKLQQIDLTQNPFESGSSKYLKTLSLSNKKWNKFKVQVTILDMRNPQFNIKNLMKMQKVNLKGMRKIDLSVKQFGNEQWQLFVWFLTTLQSLREINLSEDFITEVSFEQLETLNLIVQKRRWFHDTLKIDLRHNKLTDKAYIQIEDFYNRFQFTQVCLLTDKFYDEVYHEQRLGALAIKNPLKLIFMKVMRKVEKATINNLLQHVLQDKQLFQGRNDQFISTLKRVIDYTKQQVFRIVRKTDCKDQFQQLKQEILARWKQMRQDIKKQENNNKQTTQTTPQIQKI